MHDAYSSIGVTLGVLAKVLPSSTLRYVGRSDSMALFAKEAPVGADRRGPGGASWWLRNVGIKVLLRLRLRRVAARSATTRRTTRTRSEQTAKRPLRRIGQRREQSCAARFALLRPTDGRSFDPGECGRTQGNGHRRDRPHPDEESDTERRWVTREYKTRITDMCQRKMP